MLDCCRRLKRIIPELIIDERIKDSFATQSLCMSASKCIEDCDMLCFYYKNANEFFNELINEEIAWRSNKLPRVKIDGINSQDVIRITAIPTYIEKIRKYCVGAYHNMPEIRGQIERYEFLGFKIDCNETLCKMQSQKRYKYSESILIGMMLGLGDILYNSKYLQNDEYPQFSLSIDWTFRYTYNFAFLHDLAVYITINSSLIDWNKIFIVLTKMKANTPLIILLKLFNYIYSLIPEHLIQNYVDNVIVEDEELSSSDMLKRVNDYCTPNEILNNDYRSLFREFLTKDNICGREYSYGTLNTDISFDESLLQYTLDHNTNNPYGTPVFSGNESDKSDELAVKWGVWSHNDKLCFLLKIHNKFIVSENPIDWLNRCFTEIAIAAVDNDSHKFSELRINPSFSEEGELNILITDNANGNYELDHDVVNYEYKFENDDIYVSMAISKSYLHIPKDGMCGLDILTYCAEPWSDYSGLIYRKVLTWTGCEEKWRDPRSYAIFKLNSQKQ